MESARVRRGKIGRRLLQECLFLSSFSLLWLTFFRICTGQRLNRRIIEEPPGTGVAARRRAAEARITGTTVRVEYGDVAIAADPAGAHVISHAFPHTYGQPLAHFLRKAANVADAKVISEHPAVRVGVVFCGRQSPGGHNVIWGLHEAIKAHNPSSKLIGFLGGSDGLLAQKALEITDEVLSSYKNQGGYDMLGRTKDQIRTTEQVNGTI